MEIITIGKARATHKIPSHAVTRKINILRRHVENRMGIIPIPLEVKATTKPVKTGTAIKSPHP
tara:strand:+ start:490 stop:678 length:189 start_codon:yes stop_codon:yes gene_type:complete